MGFNINIPGKAVFIAATVALLSHHANLYGQASKDSVQLNQPVISINQSGYNLGWPKRFTVPLVADGTVFNILEKRSNKIVFTGEIRNGLGDFSAFNPVGTNQQYIIKAHIQKGGVLYSYPFGIGKYWLEANMTQPALDFMVDARSITGTHPSAYGGAPWRDGTFYSFEVPSLVLQYLSAPGFYEKAPIQANYQADKKRLLDTGFKYIMDPEGQTALETARKYYTEIDPPVGQNVPDIIQLIHWGMGYYLINPVTKDPSGGDEGRRLHPQTLEQFAYFLYGFPYYKKYFTNKFYKQAKALVQQEWNNTGLLGGFTIIGSGKGREAPGHSIMPNLLMYEVAERDGDYNAGQYFKAAYEQTQWVIDKLDFKDPTTTKGQRMSEHKLITALVYFYSRYKEKAPPKLKAKIDQWVDVAISRSQNMWDFRRYDLENNWAIPEFSETGNICGLPAIALAAASVTTDEAKKRKLEIMAMGAIDDLFGRNPQNACSAFHKDAGFTNLEKGWPKEYKRDVCARLELVRGTFSSISQTSMYPFNPDGKFGHLEGWVAFNSAWNTSLAYLNWYDTQLFVTDKRGTKIQSAAADKNDQIYLQVETPDAGSEVQVYINQTDKFMLLKQTAPGTHIYRAALSAASLITDKASTVVLSFGNALYKKSIVLIRQDNRLSVSNGTGKIIGRTSL